MYNKLINQYGYYEAEIHDLLKETLDKWDKSEVGFDYVQKTMKAYGFVNIDAISI